MTKGETMFIPSPRKKNPLDKPCGTKSDPRPTLSKLAFGLLFFGLLCLVSSSMQGSDPIISAMPQTVIAVGTNSAVQLVSFHPGGARTATDISDFYNGTCNGSLCTTSNGTCSCYQNRWNQYGKPIIVSDDGSRGADKNGVYGAQCDTNVLKNILVEALTLGLSFEHLDSGDCQHCKNIKSCSDPISVSYKEEHGAVVCSSSSCSFPQHSIDCLSVLQPYAAQQYQLTASGHLAISGTQLVWVDSNGSHPFQLVGFSDYGAIAARNPNTKIGTPLVNYTTYLNKLASYNINFTRIFLVDPWSNNYKAWFPFNTVTGTTKYDLTQENVDFITSVYNFVTYAATKGIVVEITIFDQCGIDDSDAWPYNPYRYDSSSQQNPIQNNINGYFSGYSDLVSIGTQAIACIHSDLIGWVASAVSGCGNVILEIMNEPGTTNAANFHSWVAARIRQLVPPVTSFLAVSHGTNCTINLSWNNPSLSTFTDTLIVYSTSGYPATINDGIEVTDGINTPGSHDSYIFSCLDGERTYYFSAFAHDSCGHYSARAKASATPICGASPSPSPQL
jgi:hypothetical protein